CGERGVELWNLGLRPGRVFPLRLGQKPIGLAGLLRQPRHELTGIVPRHVDHRPPAPTPVLIARLVAHPPSPVQASHCANVTSYLPTAKGCWKVTLCCGPSSLPRPFSLSGEPIRNSPAGSTTISGQIGQSRNTRPNAGAWASCASPRRGAASACG